MYVCRLQRLPLYTTATHLCSHFKVVIACSCNLGIRPSLGVRREEILNLRWEMGREREVSLPSLSPHFASPCRSRSYLITQCLHGRLEHCMTRQKQLHGRTL